NVLYYPDVLVSCHPRDIDKYFLTSPTLVVEVLSPSTAAIDRREKFLNYRQARTLEEYCLIAQEGYEVTMFRRSNRWRRGVLVKPDDVVEFGSISQTLSLAEIYSDVRW